MSERSDITPKPAPQSAVQTFTSSKEVEELVSGILDHRKSIAWLRNPDLRDMGNAPTTRVADTAREALRHRASLMAKHGDLLCRIEEPVPFHDLPHNVQGAMLLQAFASGHVTRNDDLMVITTPTSFTDLSQGDKIAHSHALMAHELTVRDDLKGDLLPTLRAELSALERRLDTIHRPGKIALLFSKELREEKGKIDKIIQELD